ncbi:MAG: deoxyribonuclease IV [Verrucomicrobiae bacterium]|nr:deoxyribonuclease IV [Verrucomicrobiae bacterium]
MPPLLGAHMSAAGGVGKAIERAVAAGCTTLQIFSKNNMQWDSKPLDAAEVARFHLLRKQTKIEPIFAHGGYLINLGAINPVFYEKSKHALVDELHRAETLKLPFVVLHPGSHMGQGEEAGMQRIATALNDVFAETPRNRVRVALEVTAGQGNCLGNRFEHIARIYKLVKNRKRLAVCLDTCHLFAAGYDMRSPRGYEQTMTELDRILGIKQVVAIHVNDSKTPLGSRVDRHTHIGKGCLGLAPFRFVMNDARFKNVPKVLETPKGEECDGVGEMDRKNLAVLRKLVRISTS